MDEKELWDKYGKLQKYKSLTIGPHSSFQLENSPRRILFSLSRYKYAAKLIGENKKILELGCSDGLGTYILNEFAEKVVAIDFDKETVEWAQKNHPCEINFICENFINKKYGEFDAVVSFDVIEHIYKKNENYFMETILLNIAEDGFCIIGTPNINSKEYSSKIVNDAHVNLYSHYRLKKLLEKYFNNVFMFGSNDEVIHTGYPEMCQYLIALGCFPKNKN